MSNKSNFGFMFRVLNFISRDYLRNYLAVGVYLPLISAKDWLCRDVDNERVALKEIEKSLKGIDDIFNL